MATPHWYTSTVFTTFNGTAAVDIDTGTFKMMLCTTSMTVAQDTHNFLNDVEGTEATGGSGYPAGGFTLAGVALSQSTNTLNWDASDISQAITGGPLAFRYGVFFKDLGGATSADPLLGYVDFGAQSVTDATLNITLTNPLTIVCSLMTDLDKLQADWEKADDKAGKLTGEYEAKKQDALDKLRERYGDRIEEATLEAAEAQKAYLDAQVVQDLLDRPDGEALGQTLVAQGGLSEEAFKAEFPDA